MFNDYTIKKMVPRIVIAIILVNLSWALCQAAITMTNTLGDGIGDLIRNAAIPSASSSDFPTFSNIGTGTAVFSWTALIFGGGAGILALFTGGVFAALGAIIAALAALVMGFLVLMFRRFFIAALVLISPLALVCWAIPGMEKWAKRWWELFIKLLLMFPFIMAMFAVSDVLAIVLKDTAGNFIGQLMLVFIRFAPFALIPLIFKVAGGAFGTLTGMVNDRGKGIFDRGKAWSKERASNTNRALRKQAKKDTKLGLRKSMAGLRAVQDVEKDINRKGLRGDYARQGLYGYGIAGGMNNEEQAKIRSNLAEQVKKQKLEFASAVVNEAVIKKGNIKDQQNEMLRLYNEGRDNGDTAMMDAAFAKLVETKGTKQLEKIQEDTHARASSLHASGDSAGADAVLRDYNLRQGTHYGSTKEFAGHIAGDLDVSKSLADTRMAGFKSLNREQLATQKDEAWETFADLSASDATVAYKSVEAAGGSSAAKLSATAPSKIVGAGGIALTMSDADIDAALADMPAGPDKDAALDRARKDRDKDSLDRYHSTL